MKVLVTGCAGFIGSHLTESLLDDGHHVVGADCFNDNYGRPQKLRNLEHAREWREFDFVPIDLSRGDLDDLVADCEVVYHLAAEPGVRASWGRRFDAYLRNNVLATQHLLEAAKGEPEQALRLRVVVLDLRAGGGLPDAGGRDPAAVLALRHHQAGRRAPVPALPRQLRRRDGDACATSRSTARGSARTWPSTASATRRSRASR